MNYRTRWTLGYAGGIVAAASLIGVVIVTIVSTTMPANAETLLMLAVWVTSLFTAAVVGGILASIYWPTQYERQHAVGDAVRAVDAMRDAFRRITPGHHR